MKRIFVNLKRFDVPKSMGGLCPDEDPASWSESVIDETIQLGLGSLDEVQLTYLFPEGLVLTAVKRVANAPEEQVRCLRIGCQGVHWEDIRPGGNFGAFTTSLPASAAKNLRCSWSILGHSEERAKHLQIIQAYDAGVGSDPVRKKNAQAAASRTIGAEVRCALQAGLNVLVCVGETAEERGGGDFQMQRPRIKEALLTQLNESLQGVVAVRGARELVIGYEPVWAIGPGKIPPNMEYIQFVSAFIKETVSIRLGFIPPVIYGGGLKEENAGMLSNIPYIDGGLVALTRFSGEIGFDVGGLAKIIDRYLSSPQEGTPHEKRAV